MSALIWVVVASAFGQFCPRSRYQVLNKGNRDIKNDKNDHWTWEMETDQKKFQNFLPLPENQLLKIFFQKIFIGSKDASWNFRRVLWWGKNFHLFGRIRMLGCSMFECSWILFKNPCSRVRIFAEHERTFEHWIKMFNVRWPLLKNSWCEQIPRLPFNEYCIWTVYCLIV